MNGFDPLAFFTPDEPVRATPETPPTFISSTESIQPTNDDDDDDEGHIHILDLPRLTDPSLPRECILTILKILRPEEIVNFGSVQTAREKTTDEILSEKDITQEEYDITKEYLHSSGLRKLEHGLITLSFSQELFGYMNKILSCPRFQSDDEVLQLASLRISENCGRTAQPGLQRSVLIKGLGEKIILNEPALTADSLGLKTWGSSLVLSELLVQRHESLIKEPVLELGAGTGLVGITLGRLGYDEVLLTDLPEILANLKKNVELNQVGLDCAVLDWTDPSSFIEEKGERKFKTIVIADPIYSKDHPRWVVNMMMQFLEKHDDARVLLQIPIREKFEQERQTLWEILETEGFKIVNEEVMSGYDDFGSQRFIYKEIAW